MIKFKHVSSKTAFILGLFGFMLYMGKINEVLANPDTLISGTLYKQEASWEISLGRFGIAILERFRQGIVNTTLTSCIAVLCAVAVSLLIIELFEISGSFRQVLCGAILIASPHVGCTLTYYYCSSFYMLSYLLAVFAVYLLTNRNIRHIVISSILFAASLSIYQSYITAAIAICYMYVLYMIIEGKGVRAILRQTLTYLVAGIGGGGIIFNIKQNRSGNHRNHLHFGQRLCFYGKPGYKGTSYTDYPDL